MERLILAFKRQHEITIIIESALGKDKPVKKITDSNKKERVPGARGAYTF